MKLALIQMNSVSDKAANLKTARELIERVVAEEKPDWICLPEVWDYIGGDRASKLEAAELLPNGPAYSLMAELSAKHGVFIHAGSIVEKVPGETRMHNTTLAFNRRGEEVARYRKIHMFDITAPDGALYHESSSFKPGEGLAAYQCEEFRVGCAICYDLRFPALFAALVDLDADLIALPAAFTQQTGRDHWTLLCRARAIETQAYFCGAAQTGAHRVGGAERRSYGRSAIIDPWGLVAAQAGDEVGYICARADIDAVKRTRAAMPVQRHRAKL